MAELKHRKSQQQEYLEHLKRVREIEKLKSEINKKNQDNAKKALAACQKRREEVIKANEKLIKERDARRKELSLQLEKQIKEAEKRQAEEAKKQEAAKKKELKETQKQAKAEARQYKVVKAREARCKKAANIKSSIKNLKISKAKNTLLIFALIGISGFTLYKSGVIQTSIADYKNKQLLESAKDIEETEEEEVIPEMPVVVDFNEVEEEEEEVVEEKHETVNTDLYDSGYEFDELITPQCLKSINPVLSDNTAWITIPGTNIDYPLVHPSVDNIDEVEGLRDEISKAEVSDRAYMNEYFLHKNLTGDDSREGSIYLDIRNNSLSNHSENLSDMNIVYGHTMRSGSMFADLKKWKYDSAGSYNQEHPYAIIYTDDGYGYKVNFITSRIISGEDPSILHANNFESYDEKNDYIQSIINDAKEQGLFTLDEYEVQENDKFICLTCCTYEYNNARYQLIGNLEKIKVRDTKLSNNKDGYYVEESSTLHR